MESNALAETFELNTEDLIKAAIENGEGTIASNGALFQRLDLELDAVQMTGSLLKKTVPRI